MIAVQLILEVHTGIDPFIHHLGPQAGRGDLLGEGGFRLLRCALEQVLQGGKQGGKAYRRCFLFLAVWVGDLRHSCPVIHGLGRCLRFLRLRIRCGFAFFRNLRGGRFRLCLRCGDFLRLRGRFWFRFPGFRDGFL